MNFEPSEEQQLLADTVKRFVATHYTFEGRAKILASPAGYSEDVWAALAEMGLLGLPFADAHGGFGGSAVDVSAQPVRCGHTPAVPGLEPGKAILRCGCGKVVPDAALMRQELGRHHRADGVAAHVGGVGLARPIAVPARDRVGAAGPQRFAEHVASLHHREYLPSRVADASTCPSMAASSATLLAPGPSPSVESSA